MGGAAELVKDGAAPVRSFRESAGAFQMCLCSCKAQMCGLLPAPHHLGPRCATLLLPGTDVPSPGDPRPSLEVDKPQKPRLETNSTRGRTPKFFRIFFFNDL